MKLIIAGGRDYFLTKEDTKRLLAVFIKGKKEYNITEIVSGGANGADRGGESFGEVNKIPVKVFVANWKLYGRSAGPIRNEEMARYADAVVLFPGGRGTSSMYKRAYANKILIWDWRSDRKTNIPSIQDFNL